MLIILILIIFNVWLIYNYISIVSFSWYFRCLHTFPTTSVNIRFNRQGTRLVCVESKWLPVVYDIPTGQGMGGCANSKLTFSAASGYSIPNYGRNIHCFAGRDDGLVVAASDDHNLFVWSLSTDQRATGDQVVGQSLVSLRGHSNNIYSVRFNHRTESLASAGKEKIIKLWTPNNFHA